VTDVVNVRESWSPAHHTVRYEVTLSGEGATVVVKNGGPWRNDQTAHIGQVDIVWRWRTGEEPKQPWSVGLRTASYTTGRLNGGTYYPSQLREVPEWLTSLVTRATPRDAS
jgi:hypothetical protein